MNTLCTPCSLRYYAPAFPAAPACICTRTPHLLDHGHGHAEGHLPDATQVGEGAALRHLLGRDQGVARLGRPDQHRVRDPADAGDGGGQSDAREVYMLLHWDGVRISPPASSTGPKGLPVATMARPSVYRYASSGVHSHLLGGLHAMLL